MSGNRAVAYMGPKKFEIQDLDFPILIDPPGKDCHRAAILQIDEPKLSTLGPNGRPEAEIVVATDELK